MVLKENQRETSASEEGLQGAVAQGDKGHGEALTVKGVEYPSQKAKERDGGTAD